MHDAAGRADQDDLVWIPGGVFRMGSDRHYPEEAPAREVAVDGFWIERAPVTNRQFAAFVRATGHRTLAEQAPSAADYPDAAPELLTAGSAVFTAPPFAVDLRQPAQWWRYVAGACWRRPYGPGSSTKGLEDHPVVHIAPQDAEAYAAWRARELPTEAEWEFAARGGLGDDAEFAWGDTLAPGGRRMANTWQGEFPHLNTDTVHPRTSPVGAYPPNGYGLVDMIGNVWEWTADFYGRATPQKACCTPRNPRNLDADASRIGGADGVARRVIKGGSHLCAPNYCRRYRPAARHPQEVDTSTSHVGFRCIARAPPP